MARGLPTDQQSWDHLPYSNWIQFKLRICLNFTVIFLIFARMNPNTW